MPPSRLENLVTTGQLKKERPAQAEFDGLLHSGSTRLKDAKNTALSLESRFDLAYNAAHSLALAALRFRGYRADSRYIVFQILPDTLGLTTEQWRVLDGAHRKRNLAEYEGTVDVDTATVEALLRVAADVESRLKALGPVPK
jgi:hypothetical protein